MTVKGILMVVIREANVNDVEVISRLINEVACAQVLVDYSADEKFNVLKSITVAAIKLYIEQGARYFVAEKKGELIGVAAIHGRQHLYHLFVAINYQRQGYGTLLWNRVKEIYLRQSDVDYFTVNAAVNALDLYLKWGFEPLNQDETLGSQNGVVTPMRLAIKSDQNLRLDLRS